MYKRGKTHKQETFIGFSTSKAISRGLIMHGLIFKVSNFSLFQRGLTEVIAGSVIAGGGMMRLIILRNHRACSVETQIKGNKTSQKTC